MLSESDLEPAESWVDSVGAIVYRFRDSWGDSFNPWCW